MDAEGKAAVLQSLKGPASASNDRGSVSAQNPKTVIDALQALAADEAMNRETVPFRMGKFVPPGT